VKDTVSSLDEFLEVHGCMLVEVVVFVNARNSVPSGGQNIDDLHDVNFESLFPASGWPGWPIRLPKVLAIVRDPALDRGEWRLLSCEYCFSGETHTISETGKGVVVIHVLNARQCFFWWMLKTVLGLSKSKDRDRDAGSASGRRASPSLSAWFGLVPHHL